MFMLQPLEIYEYGGVNISYIVYFKRKGDNKDWDEVSLHFIFSIKMF